MSEDAHQPTEPVVDEDPRLPRLEWIKIHRFRHVEPGSTLVFGSNFNVVLGRNGTGKTTLLELISAVVRGDFSKFAGEEFDVEYRFVQQEISFECRFANRQLGQTLTRRHASEFKGTLSRGEEVLAVLDSGAAVPALSEDDIRMLHPLHAAWFDWLGGVGPEQHSAILGFPRFFEQVACARFSEGVGGFDLLFAHGEVDQRAALVFSTLKVKSGILHDVAPHFSVETARRIAGKILGREDVFGSIGLSRSEVPALEVFVEWSQYSDATLTLSLLKSDVFSHYYGNPLGLFRLRTGDQIPHYQLSFGEKRFLAFLIKLHACPSTIIVDELANGMHHDWIERAVALMEDFDTQAFLSSQDPLLIDCIPLAEDTFPARNTFVLCEIGETGQLRWRNMSAEEAEDFFKSLAVGLERISEIMRSKGLW